MQCYNSFFDKSKVYLIDYDTIIGLEFGKISTKSFLIKLEESIDKNGTFKRCDNNEFEFIINGEDQYYLCLNETLMANFDKGFYTPFTKELKRLLDKKEKLDKEEELLVQANEQASIGEVIDEDAISLYVLEKRKELGLSFNDIKNYFINFKGDIKKSLSDTKDDLDYRIWPYNKPSKNQTKELIAGFNLGAFLLSLGLDLMTNQGFWYWLVPIPSGLYIVSPILVYLFNHTKNRIGRLVNFVNKRKVIKEQLRSLTKKHSKANSINDSKEDKYIVLGEEQKNDNQDISEMLLQEIANVTESLKGINDDNERKKMGLKIQELFDELNERFFQIENSEKNGKLIMDGLQALKFSMIPRISNIEREIALIISKQSIIDARNIMASKIQDELNEITGNKKLKKDNFNQY